MIDLSTIQDVLVARGFAEWGQFLGNSLDDRHIIALILEIEKLRKVENAARKVHTALDRNEEELAVYELHAVLDEFDDVGQAVINARLRFDVEQSDARYDRRAKVGGDTR